MDKAAKAVRRSGVKLLSLGGGHGDLNMVISEQKDVKNTSKSFMAAQNSAAQYLMKWAANEDNRAIQDVSNQIVELNLVWTEAQREFSEKLKDFKQMFEILLEGEKHIDQAKNNLVACEQREYKIKKELKKAAKKATADELRLLENRLMQAERQKDLAQLEVEDRIRENEAIKIIRFKEGLLKLSEAYVELGRKCAIIFESQSNIAHQMPDAHEKDLEDIKYTGSGATKRYVSQAKEKVRQYKRQQHLSQTINLPTVLNDAPPPYTPGNFYNIQDPNLDLISTITMTTTTATTTPAPSSIVDAMLYHDGDDEEDDLNCNIYSQSVASSTAGQGGRRHSYSDANLQISNISPHQRVPLPPRQRSIDLAEDLDWGSEEDLSGAMGGMKL